MRPWLAPLAAAALLCAFATPSLASFAHGLECTAVGSAVVSSCPDGSCLDVSNLDAPGSAVDISLYRSSGHHLSFSSSWDATTHAGSELTFTWSCSGTTCQCSTGDCSSSLSMMRTGTGVSVSGSWSTSGAVCVVALYRGDELLYTAPSSSPVLSFDGLPASSVIPSVDFERDGKRDLALYSVTFSSLVTLSSSPLLCDRLVVTVQDENTYFVDQCRVRCSSAPGSSCLSSLTLSSQSLMVMGTMVTSSSSLFSTAPAPHLFTFVGATASPTSMIAMRASPMTVHGGFTAEHGGGDGCPDNRCNSWSSSGPSSMRFAPGSLVLRPGVDQGASVRCDLMGSSSCSPDGVLSSLTTLCRADDLLISSRFSSMCADAESVLVLQDDDVVSRQALSLDGSVTVTPPPGGPLGMAINEKGLPGEKKPKPKPKTVTEDIHGDPMFLPSVVTGGDRVEMVVRFADVRTMCVSGQCSSGNGLVFVGQRTSPGAPAMTLHGTQMSFTKSSTGSDIPGPVVVADLSSPANDVVSAMSPTSGALSSSSSVVQVPVVIDRTDSTPARGYSITLQISPNLVLFGGSVVEYDYLSHVGGTQLYVTNEGNGRYTVDCVILGDPCGATGSGTLFTIPVSRAPGASDGTGTVSVEAVTVAGCQNDPIPCTTGSTAHVTIDYTAPTAPGTVTATQVTTGNPPGSTTAIEVSSSSYNQTEDGLVIYRSSFGHYPGYDDGGGAVPTPPSSYPPGPEWTRLTLPSTYRVCYTVNGSCWVDQPSSRDFYYYVCYSVDRAGNFSPPSSMTTGTLDYHLGDFSDGVAVCDGDDHVDGLDISALGAVYGVTFSPGDSRECMDIGPATPNRVSGRPLTDHKLNFADLILAAINFQKVSAPADRARPVAAAANSVRLLPAAMPAVGSTFDAVLAMSGAGDVQGLSAQLEFDAAVLELVSASSGELLGRQDRGSVVLTEGGRVDAALLGEGGGIAGEGELARVRFRVRAAGDPRLGITAVDARDVQNREVAVGLLSSPAPPLTRTAIRYAYPDPFDRETRVEFMLAQRAPVKIGVFDVAGRHVRTLLQGVQDAGVRSVNWDGRDDSGARRQAGVYLIRFETAGARETRTVRLVP